MTEDANLLERFVPSILGLPDREELRKEDVLVPRFLLGAEGNVQVYYSPFHHVNEDARLVLVGVTPGWSQTQLRGPRRRQRRLRGPLDGGANPGGIPYPAKR
jgi:hypothetical protein